MQKSTEPSQNQKETKKVRKSFELVISSNLKAVNFKKSYEIDICKQKEIIVDMTPPIW